MEKTGYHVVPDPDPEGGYVAAVPASPGCYSQGDTENTPRPDELSAEDEPLDWEGEGWS